MKSTLIIIMNRSRVNDNEYKARNLQVGKCSLGGAQAGRDVEMTNKNDNGAVFLRLRISRVESNPP